MAVAKELFHFGEHLDGKKGRSIAQRCSAFEMIQNLANADKHSVRSTANPIIKSARDIQEAAIVIIYSDDQGEYQHTKTSIIAQCTDGTVAEIDPYITNMFNFWSSYLAGIGEIEHAQRPCPPTPGSVFVSRIDAKSLNLEILQPAGYKMLWQYLRFDNDAGKATPIDFNGAKMEMNIYRPSYVLELTLSRKDKEDISIELVLDDEQSVKWHLLKTDDEREAFGKRIRDERISEIREKYLAAVAHVPVA